MSTTKNYGLAGIGSDVQLGKAGGRFVYSGGVFKFTSDGSTLIKAQVAAPTTGSDVANKTYVDSVAAGLDPKESCRLATTAALSGVSYSPTGGTGGTGGFTSVTDTIDGVTVATNNRILVKNQADAKQNGIYIVVTVGTGANGVWERASDHDGSPTSEVTSGNFTFIEQGTVNSDSGWVLQGNGVLTLNTDNLNWVQFTGAGQITAGAGLTKSGNTIDVGTASATRIVVNADNIDLASTSVTTGPQGSATAVATYTVDTYGRLTAAGSTTIAIPSTQVTDFTEAAQDAVGGMVTATGVGVDLVYNDATPSLVANLDISGLSTIALATGDAFAFYDTSGTTHGKVTIDDLVTYVTANGDDNKISQGNSAVTVTDAGTGNIAINVDASDVMTFLTGGVTVPTGKTLTITDLTAGRVIYSGTAGVLTTEAAFTYVAASDTLSVGASGTVAAGNLSISANTLASTDTNGNIVLNPNGTGVVVIESAAAGTIQADSTQALNVLGGPSSSGTAGGVLTVAGGANSSTGAGGAITLRGGDTTGSGTGGAVTIRGGNSNSGTDGAVTIMDANGSAEIFEFINNSSAVNHAKFTPGATGTAANLSTSVTGADTNIGLTITLNGTGTLRFTNTTYEANVLNDDDVPNKKYVDDAVAAGTPSGGISSATASVNLASATVQTIGTLPANAMVVRVKVITTVISDAVTTVTVGDPTNGAASYMAAVENDTQILGTYVADTYVQNGGASRTIGATVATAGTTGTAICVVEYRLA